MTYVQFESGDSIKADPLNTMQQMIEEDIRKQIEAAKQELRCPKRYFLDIEVLLSGGQLQPAVLTHGLGCHPIVQVYELETLPIPGTEQVFCVCAPPDFSDLDAIDFETKSHDEFHWGISLDDVVKQFSPDVQNRKFKEGFSLGAWIRNLQDLLFEEGPAAYHFNMGDIYRTKWIAAREERTVQSLRNQDEWPPRFVYRARLVNNLIVRNSTGTTGVDAISTKKGGVTVDKTTVPIGIFHLNLNEVEIKPETNTRTRLMVLLGS